jgi:hypothetical protein
MSASPQRNWTLTYVKVLAVEVLVLLALWWFQRLFRI